MRMDIETRNTLKFKVGDKVKFNGKVVTILELDQPNRYFPYYTDGAGWVAEEALELVAASSEIEKVYRVDGIIFETEKEAIDHVKTIKLFDMMDTESMSASEYNLYADIIDKLVEESDKYAAILKGI